MCKGIVRMVELAFIGFIFVFSTTVVDTAPQFPAMFVFGDSLVDNGNNNYLASLAKANYVPYGVDFNRHLPTGRFCNGKTIIDFLGDSVGLPQIPAYAAIRFKGANHSLKGVNYASAGGGILDDTGRHLGDRYNFKRQIQNFRNSMTKLKTQIGNDNEFKQYLTKSLVVVVLGNNDYINNYFLATLYPTIFMYKPQDFANLLIKRYTTHILAISGLGVRKFLLAGIGPVGCMPVLIASGLASPGKCVGFVNDMVVMFNAKLRALVDELNKNHNGTIFVFGNTFAAFSDILDNTSTYGFQVKDKGCCGVGGRISRSVTCLPFSIPCMNRDKYIFWDAFHPTQAMNKILAQRAYQGPQSYCYPINVKQLALL